ncbi:hypothetical protein ACLOJK_000145 [Asimina triloba]
MQDYIGQPIRIVYFSNEAYVEKLVDPSVNHEVSLRRQRCYTSSSGDLLITSNNSLVLLGKGDTLLMPLARSIIEVEDFPCIGLLLTYGGATNYSAPMNSINEFEGLGFYFENQLEVEAGDGEGILRKSTKGRLITFSIVATPPIIKASIFMARGCNRSDGRRTIHADAQKSSHVSGLGHGLDGYWENDLDIGLLSPLLDLLGEDVAKDDIVELINGLGMVEPKPSIELVVAEALNECEHVDFCWEVRY